MWLTSSAIASNGLREGERRIQPCRMAEHLPTQQKTCVADRRQQTDICSRSSDGIDKRRRPRHGAPFEMVAVTIYRERGFTKGRRKAVAMATKRLARELGIIRRISSTSPSVQSRPKLRQLFNYLIVIDFESTCWNDNRGCYAPEIIEFPAVLLNTSNGEVESEFHAYVQPQEHPILSKFCTELTGITQDQVDEGAPLHICISQFSKWIKKIHEEKNVIFISNHSSGAALESQLCAFVTWSDWDLGVCLHYECKRKQLQKPAILNSWIDLRAIYKLFYSRKPRGLNGALQDVGIVFTGREHSGMDDSRNTAQLAWKMICDGCVMKITKSLDKVPPANNSIARFLSPKATSGPLLGNKDGAERSCLEQNRRGEVAAEKKNKENQQQGLTPMHLHGRTHLFRRNKKNEHDMVPSCSNLDASKQNSPLGHFQSSSSSSFRMQNGRNNDNLISDVSAHKPGLVLVPTVISTVNISNIDISTASECLSMLADWEDVTLIPESQGDQRQESLQLMSDTNRTLLIAGEGMQTNPSNIRNSASENFDEAAFNLETSKSILYKSSDTIIYNTGVGPSRFSNTSEFKLPPSKANISSTSSSNCKSLFGNSSEAPKRKPSSPKYLPPAKKLPFAIYEDKDASSCSYLSSGSHGIISTTILKSSVNLNQSLRPTDAGRVTPPLCKCGRRARRLSVSNGGPNHGKVFYTCPVGKQEGSKKSCGYFKWEHSLLKEKRTRPFTSNVGGPPSLGTSCSSSGHSQGRHLGLRPSMRT